MTREDVQKLRHGLHRLHWKVGGHSLASVGSLHDGRRWFACTNWTGAEPDAIASTAWRGVERAELILAWELPR